MEANKIKGESKSIVLSNGVELTYCERGETHTEIMVCGAFYFHTAMPLVDLPMVAGLLPMMGPVKTMMRPSRPSSMMHESSASADVMSISQR